MRQFGLFIVLAALTVGSCGSDPRGVVVLDSLSQPRGIAVDGSRICVAEAGEIGPDGPTREQPGQLEADTGRVVCTPLEDEEPETVLDELPFVYYPDAAVTSGAADVASDSGDLWVLVGESYGELARSIVAIEVGEASKVVDLLAFAESRQIASDGLKSNPFSFVLAPDRAGFFVADAATGTVLQAGMDGVVELFATVPGHEVLTGMAWGPDGDLYVASFGQLPHPEGSGAVLAVDRDGRHRVVVDGLTMPIDVGFDTAGGLLILEYSSPPEDPGGTDAYRDRTGALLHVSEPESDTTPTVLLDRLDRPTGLSVGTGSAWISISAGEQAPGAGLVERYSLSELIPE